MPATTIHFVRHGKVYNPNHVLYERLPGYHLSQRGARMAAATARFLALNPATQSVSALYTSPLERAQETAGIIRDQINLGRRERGERPLDLIEDGRLIEAGNEFRGKRIGRGDGALWRDGNWRLLTNLMRPSWGESYQSIAGRVSDFVREQLEHRPGEQIIVVSHESPIWSFRHMLETGRPEHNMLLRRTALASVTSVTFESGSGSVLGITYADPAARLA
ncbi:phosphoglycerate mutase [Bifidobacterium actinocoloniiforme DSM 22766]|uniref:Phosphoglycerate mutase n=1 Tax=Bifidobacterium actinocoloniiforme DSM 22766 TaxID=1437605 RepID=A0A086Z1W5_9BIFI|nr:histidine phosphatase family protein [Bifidobacterium actinocoloniiforme]AKV55613.1 phosphoglycerate mutase [Bifidobacterium actinocoloniiforme DSM 22766]KFI40515.1 phosphoglycerate mutase [Bifidobacterium actinocoloniiforme DSM 22766]